MNSRWGRTAGTAIAMLVLLACGRERWSETVATTVAAQATTKPTAEPSASPSPAPVAPKPTAAVAAAEPAAPRPTQAIPSTELPDGPDGEDDTKRDSGVRGRVMAGERPVADAVVFIKGDGYQANSTTGPGGRFHLHAPSGSYLVGARANNASVYCDDQTVMVGETSFTTITIDCTR